MKRLLIYFLTIVSITANAQDAPEDFLKKEFHDARRAKLREKLPKNSVAVFFANPVRNRANDVEYAYHQDPDFYYLTGYKEPDAVLFIFKEKQAAANGKLYDEIIFVQPRNAAREMWTGRRLGDEGVKTTLGLEQSFNNTEFKKYNLDFNKFDKILFFDFKNDVRNEADTADLYDLIAQFKVKVNYPTQATGLAVNREPEKIILMLLISKGSWMLCAELRQKKKCK
jgi:Xaa-Pro aminopeptidase